MKNLFVKFFLDRIFSFYKDEVCHLWWDKKRPWTLLFAVILSAQSTDKQVNLVTPLLFTRFSTLSSFASAPLREIEKLVFSTGFYRNKARHLQECARALILRYGGELPDSLDELVTLPGVGRKTANVILWNVFSKNEGFVVDTHVSRISFRTGLSREKYADKIELDLMNKFPQEHWGRLSHMLVQFGRDYCTARNPKCDICFLRDRCPRNGLKK